MPAPPEFADAGRKIGIIEVFGEGEAEHGPEADGHVGITGKVIVDLQPVIERPQPGHGGAHPGGVQGEHLVRLGGKAVGQNDLFGKAVQKALRAEGKALGRHGAAAQLGLDVGVAHDGPRHQLGEKADVERQQKPVFLGLDAPAVEVDDIAHGLEGVKTDAQGQGDVPHGQHLPAQKPRQGVGGKAVIFIVAQQREVRRHHRRQHQRTAPAGEGGEGQPAQIVQGDGGQHQKDVHRLAPGVKEKADRQQQGVFAPAGHKAVGHQHHRQKDPQKNKARKQHRRPILPHFSLWPGGKKAALCALVPL